MLNYKYNDLIDGRLTWPYRATQMNAIHSFSVKITCTLNSEIHSSILALLNSKVHIHILVEEHIKLHVCRPLVAITPGGKRNKWRG